MTPVAPAVSWSRSIAVHESRSTGMGTSVQVSPSGSPTTRRPRLRVPSGAGSWLLTRSRTRSVRAATAPSSTHRPGESPATPIMSAPAASSARTSAMKPPASVIVAGSVTPTFINSPI